MTREKLLAEQAKTAVFTNRRLSLAHMIRVKLGVHGVAIALSREEAELIVCVLENAPVTESNKVVLKQTVDLLGSVAQNRSIFPRRDTQ